MPICLLLAQPPAVCPAGAGGFSFLPCQGAMGIPGTWGILTLSTPEAFPMCGLGSSISSPKGDEIRNASIPTFKGSHTFLTQMILGSCFASLPLLLLVQNFSIPPLVTETRCSIDCGFAELPCFICSLLCRGHLLLGRDEVCRGNTARTTALSTMSPKGQDRTLEISEQFLTLSRMTSRTSLG